MAQLSINITLDNIDAEIDPNQIASLIEGIVKSHTGSDVKTNIYDNDSSTSSNPIMAQNILRRVR